MAAKLPMHNTSPSLRMLNPCHTSFAQFELLINDWVRYMTSATCALVKLVAHQAMYLELAYWRDGWLSPDGSCLQNEGSQMA
mmetsp:Transcript_14170/g.38384  ORF Transcript_14170/g.38384 Transcript_14170/m.38384 type:complete len:82 (-) Transcript_14170:102-347(-)|eukprot:899771-Pelagomonas_calceolata.AAC.3